MSEEAAKYTVDNGVGFDLVELARRDCARPFADPRYQPPTPEEVGGLIKLAGWSQKKVALLVGAHYNDKGSSAIRKWRTPVDRSDHREIPYSAWRLMLLHSGAVPFEQDLDFSDEVRKAS